MTKDDLKKRTKDFALRVIKLVNALPKNRTADIIGKQLLRSSTSIGANYRAACLGRSKAEFISKLATVIEETDESIYWMELIVESNLMKKNLLDDLMKEAGEILAIMITTKKSALNS